MTFFSCAFVECLASRQPTVVQAADWLSIASELIDELLVEAGGGIRDPHVLAAALNALSAVVHVIYDSKEPGTRVLGPPEGSLWNVVDGKLLRLVQKSFK
jgi:hypothetical protein